MRVADALRSKYGAEPRSDPAPGCQREDGCDSCKRTIYEGELVESLRVCKSCGFHFDLTAPERIEQIADESDLEEVHTTERHLLYVACTRAREHLFEANPAQVGLEIELNLVDERGMPSAYPTGTSPSTVRRSVVHVLPYDTLVFCIGSVGNDFGFDGHQRCRYRCCYATSGS